MAETVVADEEIMEAVHRALRSHGYADLTMQDIADECSKSKSLLHYHYDTKADLLAAFLDQLLTEYETRLACRADRSPPQRIVEFVARFVFAPADDDREAFHLALLEMRSQSPFDDRIREQLERSDRILRETVAAILADGVESGVFTPVDIDRTAALIVAAVDGARTRQITLGGRGPATVDEDDTELTYTRVVAEETLAQIVEPLLVEGEHLPPLDDALESLERSE